MLIIDEASACFGSLHFSATTVCAGCTPIAPISPSSVRGSGAAIGTCQPGFGPGSTKGVSMYGSVTALHRGQGCGTSPSHSPHSGMG